MLKNILNKWLIIKDIINDLKNKNRFAHDY